MPCVSPEITFNRLAQTCRAGYYTKLLPVFGLLQPRDVSESIMQHKNSFQELLRQCRSVAVVGAKDKPEQPVDRVGRYLLERGMRVCPVHPVRQDVWGLPTVPHLADLTKPVDIVDLFRAPQYCVGHAREVLALPWRPRIFWMQSGITSPDARALLEPEGILVVEDACLMVELGRLTATAPALERP